VNAQQLAQEMLAGSYVLFAWLAVCQVALIIGAGKIFKLIKSFKKE
jgi:hypothetical protein